MGYHHGCRSSCQQHPRSELGGWESWAASPLGGSLCWEEIELLPSAALTMAGGSWAALQAQAGQGCCQYLVSYMCYEALPVTEGLGSQKLLFFWSCPSMHSISFSVFRAPFSPWDFYIVCYYSI